MSSKANFSELPVAAESTFPVGSLVPKVETGVLGFLQKYPEYDGRDVTIAILDSGVDPRAIGLETLCDGKTVKVVERFDCTGCGDVDTSKKVTADNNNVVVGLSGRELRLTPQMIQQNTAKGEYRLGMKSFDDLVPTKTRDNMKNARKRIEWDSENKMAIAEVTRKINNFESQNSDTSKLSWDKKLDKDNLDYTLEILNSYDKSYNEVKTTYDCLLYPTEKGWQACIDINENGDLENALFINEYTKSYEVKNINDYLCISINVHDDGDVLEVVGMCSPHGTHVASIASGNHESKDYNGVAPNAKIVSLTIGDGRLGSMETGTALVRAMLKIMELCRTGRKVDVINMSYGEHSHWSNTGRIGELMTEIVSKYGVVWVASAGNHGPALCTVGTPPDISQPVIIGVGAYVSPQVMEAEYAMREKLPANVYTWTSRDPCIDGGQGVTVCAPGSAITSVPQFTMTKSQLMNGTSMAAPHVAGAIAILISALKQLDIPYSPYSIKRAISVTATKLSYVDAFAQGHGLLNVEKAFEHLNEYREAVDNLLNYRIRCGINNSKGIHLRRMFLDKTYEVGVTVDPIFLNDKEVAPEEKFNFNIRLNLIPSQPFVQVGAYLDLSYQSRSLNVKIDPVGLAPGVHTAVIRAFDTDCVQRGCLFEIPITIVQPHVVQPQDMLKFTPSSIRNDASIEFHPNTIVRNFILVPKGATWAVFRIRSTDQHADKDHGRFFIHTMQLLPKMSCRVLELMKIFSVRPEIDTVIPFRVQENCIIEVCLAKYWSNYGVSHVRYNVEFHGVQLDNLGACAMHAGRGIHKLTIQALNIEEVQPAISLKHAAVILKPTDSKISPLSSTRDVVPDGRQIYQNLLTYCLNVTKANEVMLHAPLFNSILYESEFESQLWMLFDSNKAMIACGDAHSDKFNTKLDKGEYTIRLQIRHEKRDLLEKISEATIFACYKLSNPIVVDLYDTYNQAVISGKKFVNSLLRENCPKLLFAPPLSQEKLTKANLPTNCACLLGSIVLPKDEYGRRVDGMEFAYYLSPSDNAKKNGNGCSTIANLTTSISKVSITSTSSTLIPAAVPSSAGDGSSPLANTVASSASSTNGNPGSPKKGKNNDDYVESLRDFQSGMITKCEPEIAEKIYEEVIALHPKHLVAHLNLLQNIESQNSDSKVLYPFSFIKSLKDNDVKSNEEQKVNNVQRTTLERILKLADLVINETDKDALLAFYGLKNDTRPDANKIKSNMDKQKANLVEALARKGIAVVKLSIIDDNTKDRLDDIDNIYTEVMKFSDITDSKVIQFSLWHAYAHQHYGRMSKYLQKMYDDKRQREYLEEFGLVANAMEYSHLQTVVDRLTVASYPATYRIF